LAFAFWVEKNGVVEIESHQTASNREKLGIHPTVRRA
jgi:hypothetical protein